MTHGPSHLWDQGLTKKAAHATKTRPARLQLNTDTSEQFAEVIFYAYFYN